MTNHIQYLQADRAYTIWKKLDMLRCYDCHTDLKLGEKIIVTKSGGGRRGKLRCYECAERYNII